MKEIFKAVLRNEGRIKFSGKEYLYIILTGLSRMVGFSGIEVESGGSTGLGLWVGRSLERSFRIELVGIFRGSLRVY